MIGNVIGNYKVIEKIGEGGMGAVYRGVDLMLEREVAVKALRPELGSQPQVVERFRSEAVTLAKLNHPNVATLYSFFRQSNDYFMVLEFVRGLTLDHVIQQRGALPCELALPLFCQVLDGIDHAHRFGIIHRDIKPANMMLTEAGTLKVLDFGIARILGTARMTKAGHLIGTIEYMSPEQVRGQETDARSDIYALGMLLYEMLTGRVPFTFENEFELMKAQVEATPTPPSQLNPTIPPAVEQAVMRAVAKHPDDRFQTAGEFRNVLLDAGYAAATGAPGQTAPGVSPYTTRPLTNPPISHPPFSNPPISNPAVSYSSPSSDSPIPTLPVSGEAASGDEKSVPNVLAPPPPHAPTSSPGVPTGGGIKETRLGTATGGDSLPGVPTGTGDHPKETRLGVPAAATPFASQQPFAPLPQAAPPSPSFFSKLTWVHYAGAGLALLFLLGVPLVYLLSGGGGQGPAQTPAATQAQEQTTALPEQPSTEQPPTVTPGQSEADPGGQGTEVAPVRDGAAPSAPESATQTVIAPPVLPTAESAASARGPARQGDVRQPAQKPSVKPPAQAKPKADSAEVSRRKREAALKALEN